MKILALDTSTETCTLALCVGGQVWSRRHAGAREQTLHVLPLAQALLAEAGVALAGLDAIACAHGPGAFTGVRVAVSVAQGLAFSARIPAIGISTLAALAQQAVRLRGATHILPVLDARMGELYAGAYRTDDDGVVTALAPDRLLRPEDFAAGVPSLPAGGCWAAIGSGWPLLAEAVEAVPVDMAQAIVAEPDALDVLALACRAFSRGDTVSAEQLLPVYLRDTVAWKKLAEQGRP